MKKAYATNINQTIKTSWNKLKTKMILQN